MANVINDDYYRVQNPEDGKRGDQIVFRSAKPALVIDVTVSNANTPEINKRRGLPKTGVVVRQREQFKISKYHQSCEAAGQIFLPMAFEVQGRPGDKFMDYFREQITRRSAESGIPKVPLTLYWSRRISLALQRSVAQAINLRLSSLYNPLEGKLADESSWEGVICGQTASVLGSIE